MGAIGKRRGAAIRILAGAGIAGVGVAGAAAAAHRVHRRAQPAQLVRIPQLVDAFPQAREVGALLRRSGLSVAVAESSTGGLLGAALTAVPGSSAYVRGGVIAYADDVKRSLLDVGADLLETDGAVSESVAVAMAKAVQNRLGADIGLAITGIAGPGGEQTSKKVGLSFVAAAGPGGRLRVERLAEDHGREANRAEAVRVALRLCGEAAATAGAQ